MNTLNFLLNWILNWMIFLRYSMFEWIIKIYRPGLDYGDDHENESLLMTLSICSTWGRSASKTSALSWRMQASKARLKLTCRWKLWFCCRDHLWYWSSAIETYCVLVNKLLHRDHIPCCNPIGQGFVDDIVLRHVLEHAQDGVHHDAHLLNHLNSTQLQGVWSQSRWSWSMLIKKRRHLGTWVCSGVAWVAQSCIVSSDSSSKFFTFSLSPRHSATIVAPIK